MTTLSVHMDDGMADQGHSLVELMVSLSLGLVLSAGIISIYLESKRNFVAEEEMARIQENGRFALSLLKREMTLAGFYGGYLTFDELAAPTSGDERVTPDCAAPAWALDISEPLELINDFDRSAPTPWKTTSGASLTCIGDPDDVQPGTDILTIKRTAGEPTAFAGAWAGARVPDTNQMYLNVEDYGDSKRWYYHRSGGFPSTLAADPNDAINQSEYWEMYSKVFYVRTYSVEGDDIPTLCMRSLVGNKMEQRCLVEGVENMQVVFGVDTDTDPGRVPNRYVSDPNDLNAVVTARLYLLMRSIGELPGSDNTRKKSYQLGPGPNTVETSDGYLRRIFSTTVQMRNATWLARAPDEAITDS